MKFGRSFGNPDVATILRYSLFQIPGIVITAVVLALAVRWRWLSAATAYGLLLLWILKDAALYPLLRSAYTRHDASYAAKLLGRIARVRGTLAPSGYVSIDGELWRSRTVAGDPPVTAGETVVIVDYDGSVLVVSQTQGVESSLST